MPKLGRYATVGAVLYFTIVCFPILMQGFYWNPKYIFFYVGVFGR